MAKFLFTPIVGEVVVQTARLGAGTGTANFFSDADVGKAVKLAGDSRYDLCAVGDEIEGWVMSINVASQDNYTIGSVGRNVKKGVTFDGSQAAGTGAIAVGDYLVSGTPVAKGTALVFPAGFKVRKATDQVLAKSSPFAFRVVSLGSAGTGAVGTTGIAEFVR